MYQDCQKVLSAARRFADTGHPANATTLLRTLRLCSADARECPFQNECRMQCKRLAGRPEKAVRLN